VRSQEVLPDPCAGKISPPLNVKKKRSGLCELFQHVDAFRRGEFAVIFVIEITMNAAFVAAVRQIEMNAQRQALAHSPRDQAVHQKALPQAVERRSSRILSRRRFNRYQQSASG